MTMVTAGELRRDKQHFLRFKRALGFTYERGELTLNAFVDFISRNNGEHGRTSLEQEIKRWCIRPSTNGRKPVSLSVEISAIRQLCLFRRRRDQLSYVPDISHAPVTEALFEPYIFSLDEIRRILAATKSYVGHRFSPKILRPFILLLYCTGLRLGEAVRLHVADVNLDNGQLFVRESKGRSRIVPIRPDLVRELRRYASERNRIVRTLLQSDPERFFLLSNGSSIPTSSASNAIRYLLRSLGMKPASGRRGPRPYEFRHAFAVHRLTAWARAGLDIHAMLPLLSAYLGHQNIIGTEVYLKATPELLKLASRRFERHVLRPRRTK